jgi:hypothetical protein
MELSSNVHHPNHQIDVLIKKNVVDSPRKDMGIR